MIKCIFYYEGEIPENSLYEGVDIIDAKYGYLANMSRMDKFVNDDNEHKVLTNQVALLKNKYCWDKEKHRPEILVKDRGGKWKHITSFTKQHVKYAHNLEAMYRVGVFKI